jgi:predicted nuclease with TOPRIM domain
MNEDEKKGLFNIEYVDPDYEMFKEFKAQMCSLEAENEKLKVAGEVLDYQCDDLKEKLESVKAANSYLEEQNTELINALREAAEYADCDDTNGVAGCIAQRILKQYGLFNT